jgi:hypothetical protein
LSRFDFNIASFIKDKIIKKLNVFKGRQDGEGKICKNDSVSKERKKERKKEKKKERKKGKEGSQEEKERD